MPCSLLDSLAHIRDPRQASGKRHSLPAILLLVFVGLLCNQQTTSAIAQWVRWQPREFWRTLGFNRQPPCPTTISNLMARLGLQPIEDCLNGWAISHWQNLTTLAGDAIAVDGKTLRGSRKQGGENPHLLSAFSHRLKVTLGQKAVPDKTNEIGEVSQLLESLPLANCVVTADAMLTQRRVAELLLAAKADYVMPVKENQPHLYDDLTFLLHEKLLTHEHHTSDESLELGHGRLEVRRLIARTVPPDYQVNWPGIQQLVKIIRQTTFKNRGKSRQEVSYAVTSLSPQRASAKDLQVLIRGHWSIENLSHWVRDVVMGEDANQCRVAQTSQILAVMRNTVLSLLRLHGIERITQAMRRFAARPMEALHLIQAPLLRTG